jgi:hypothetical protein
MADYYPVLARAVSSLPQDNAQARLELYELARTIVAEELGARDRRGLAPEILREQAAFETAVRRVEAEAQARTEATARRLATILQDIEPYETRADKPESSARLPATGANVQVEITPTNAIGKGDNGGVNAAAELGKMPNSLGAMLFGIAYIVAAIAFTSVTYIRASMWMEEGIIRYPVLLAIVAITLSLFIVAPVAIFRKTSNLRSRRTVRLSIRRS